ncbi:Macrolide-efflux protein [Shewanella piezotolerans WP3]|uniref:Macrolide-efflux protein n=1 Tax=Shewanella piezotolerans (strain WP3 / JCM 13877) TaxID=225849 RepID=B8CTR4_SHEPW|nr:Macrolide-efflux protein [Shewanella piezotolerans WP3]
MYELTDSVLAFALAFTSEFVFSLLLQGFSGSFVDRYSPKRVLVINAALISAVFLAVVGLTWSQVSLPAGLLFGLALVINFCRPFFRAATFAIVPEVVSSDQYEKINSYISIALQVGQIVGMVLAGVLLELASMHAVITCVGGCYLLSLVGYWQLKPKGLDKTSNQVAKASWKTVFDFIKKSPFVMGVYIIGALDFAFIGLFNLMLAPVVRRNYDSAERWLTILDMSFAAGAILAGFYIVKRKQKLGIRLDMTVLSIMAAGLTFVAFWLQFPDIVVITLIALFGGFLTMSTVVWSTTLQQISPPQIKGRLASIKLVCNSFFITVSTLGASALNRNGFEASLGFSVVCACIAMVIAVGVYTMAQNSFGFRNYKLSQDVS